MKKKTILSIVALLIVVLAIFGITKFVGAEGKGGGEFYTPKSIVSLMVEMIQPFKGYVYDPACGSGGMFVQSLKFVEEHSGNAFDISV